MYVPLGGRTNQMWNVWPIFLFVAIWHDIEPKLLAWGGLNSIFYILEVLPSPGLSDIVQIIGKELSKFLLVKLTPTLRQAIEVFCSAFYILVLIAINLVGYALGVGGVSSMLVKMFSQEGILTLISAFGFLAVGVCVMGLIKKTQ
jgi:protein-cysteine N-palmitoyltransferase HHAT